MRFDYRTFGSESLNVKVVQLVPLLLLNLLTCGLTSSGLIVLGEIILTHKSKAQSWRLKNVKSLLRLNNDVLSTLVLWEWLPLKVHNRVRDDSLVHLDVQVLLKMALNILQLTRQALHHNVVP